MNLLINCVVIALRVTAYCLMTGSLANVFRWLRELLFVVIIFLMLYCLLIKNCILKLWLIQKVSGAKCVKSISYQIATISVFVMLAVKYGTGKRLPKDSEREGHLCHESKVKKWLIYAAFTNKIIPY